MQPAFEAALRVIRTHADAVRARAARARNAASKERQLALSELYDPEVRYRDLYEPTDLARPVYKLLEERRWRRRSLPLMMQRVEQLHVIPDTLPTLRPQAETLVRWRVPGLVPAEPGQFVKNAVCLRRPLISVRDFGMPAGASALYTVAIVNPDIPDLEADSYRTELHFLATNARASLTSPELQFDSVLRAYTPPVPEKNAPAQRMCVWVFRQQAPIEDATVADFDVRAFVAKHNLDPVSAFVWRSKFDETSEGVRERLGMPPGRVFYRARTARPEEALLHVREEPKWKRIDARFGNA